MSKLIVATCLIATICAYHIEKFDYNVVLETVEHRNIPNKLQFGKGAAIPEGALAPMEEILKKVTSELKINPRAGTEALMNDYADQIFTNLQDLIIHNGLDPLEVPDEHAGFSFTIIITYHGELDLTRGWLSDLSTMYRGGDVLVNYSTSTKYLVVTVPIAFEDLQFTYDYSAKLMGLGPTGGIAGKIANIGIEVKIGFDVENFVASLDEFIITNSGHIDVNFNGNPLVDWITNLLTDVATSLLKPVILLIVESIIRGSLEGVVTAISDAINDFLNPSTPVPGATTASLFLS